MLGAPRSYLSRLIFSGLLLASNMRHTCADDTAGDSTSSSAALRAMSRSKLDADLLLAFQGKGSALAFDLGVVKRMARDLSAMTDDRV
ncbi:MAG TPA: hypothetical protein VG713_13745, partial [Pirellulales bacterium]|nr:hypothetical protein [Pirellulales bacterium]